MVNKALYSSNRDDWETPEDLFQALNEEFHFTIDVASDDNNCKCKRHFTKEQDGLKQPWHGDGETVWCNPPYGRGIVDWVQKAFVESKFWNTTCVMLLPARTDTKWFHVYVAPHAEVRFIRGRLKFGNRMDAPFPSMIVIFRGDDRIQNLLKEGNGKDADSNKVPQQEE